MEKKFGPIFEIRARDVCDLLYFQKINFLESNKYQTVLEFTRTGINLICYTYLKYLLTIY